MLRIRNIQQGVFSSGWCRSRLKIRVGTGPGSPLKTANLGSGNVSKAGNTLRHEFGTISLCSFSQGKFKK
jgi:hypothetical protein